MSFKEKIILIIFFFVSQSFAFDMKKSDDALRSAPLFGDGFFLLNQARMLQNKQPYKINMRYIEERKKIMGYVSEYELAKVSTQKNFFQVPIIKIGKDINFQANQSRVLSGNIKVQENYQAQGLKVLSILEQASTCKNKNFDIMPLPDYEYVSTHQVFAIIWMYNNKCISVSDYKAYQGNFASRVYQEFMANQNQPLSDLQVERAAILCMAKLCNEIPKTFFQKLMSEQMSDGLWRFKHPLSPQAITYEHATALAYFALSAGGYK
jgi:hypothetical protein